MSRRKTNLVHEPLEPLILVIRNQRVILDADLARLYGVQTKVFNQAVRRNSSRFPEDFAFQLTTAEVAGLRSQTVTSNQNTLEDYEDTGTGRNRRGGRRYRPWAFTEHGAIMAANILRSDRAIQMSLFVVRAFVRLREHITANQAIPKRLARDRPNTAPARLGAVGSVREVTAASSTSPGPAQATHRV